MILILRISIMSLIIIKTFIYDLCHVLNSYFISVSSNHHFCAKIFLDISAQFFKLKKYQETQWKKEKKNKIRVKKRRKKKNLLHVLE